MTVYNIQNNGKSNHVTKSRNTVHIITSTTKLNENNMNHLVLEIKKDARGSIDLKEVYIDLWISKLNHENKINLFINDTRVWMKRLKPKFNTNNFYDIDNNTDALNVWEGIVNDFKVKIEITDIDVNEFTSKIIIEEK